MPSGIEAVRLAVHILEGVGHDGELLRRLDDRVADQVRERQLAAARRELAVERRPAREEDVHGDVAERRRRGDGQRVRHVLDEAGGGAGERREAGRGTVGKGEVGSGEGGDGCGRLCTPSPLPPSRFPQYVGAARQESPGSSVSFPLSNS